MTDGDKRDTVLIVDDDHLLARSIKRILEVVFKTKIVGSLDDARRSFSLVQDLRAIIVDVNLPDGNGLDFAEEARRACASLPIIVITGYSSTEISLRALLLGARLLLKPFDKYQMEIIRDFLAGMPGPNLAARERTQSGLRELTRKQKEVLSFAIADQDRHRMCESLNVAPTTLKSHIRGILEKYHARNLKEVVQKVRGKNGG